MRILFLSTWFPYPADNGSKIRVKYLLHALGQQHEVTLLSFAFGTAQPELANGLCCTNIETIEVNPFVENQTGSVRRFLSTEPVNYRPIEAMWKLVNKTLGETRFEVVIASTEVMATYALQAQSDTIKMLEEHNSLTRMMRERYESGVGLVSSVRQWVSWQKTWRYEAKLFNQFDLVTMVSEQDRELSERILTRDVGRVAVVPNGVDCEHNRPGLTTKQPHLLIFNGSLTYDANYDAMAYFLSDIYPLIRAQMPEVSLKITGSTEGVELELLVLDKTVLLTGYVEDVRIPVAGASICVVPLRQGGGTRLKILEAMALGTAVVSTAKGAEGLEVVDGEQLLIADDPGDFANRVVGLLGDDRLRKRLSANARRLVEEKYDWQQIGARFVALVEETVVHG